MDQSDTIRKIELIPLSVLSTDNTNSQVSPTVCMTKSQQKFQFTLKGVRNEQTEE